MKEQIVKLPTDEEIIEKFRSRDEEAVILTRQKYGRLFFGIAERITGNRRDSEECENDTYFRLWGNIPPENPSSLKAYGARIVRNFALSRIENETAQKRCCDGLIDELEEVLPDSSDDSNPENMLISAELSIHIDSFLHLQSRKERIIFVKRYFYGESLRQIANELSIKEATVKTKLFRTREKLKKHLRKEGVSL